MKIELSIRKIVLGIVLTAGLIVLTGCNCQEATSAKAGQRYNDNEFEEKIYHLVKNIAENKPSDLVVLKGEDSVIFCSRGVADLVKALSNDGPVSMSGDLLDSVGFYFELKHSEDAPNNVDIEFAYFNHLELKGDVVFGFKVDGDKVWAILGIERGKAVVYTQDESGTKRVSKDSKVGTTSETSANQAVLKKYFDLAQKIKANYK